MDNKIYITTTMPLEEINIVLDALQARAESITELRETLRDTAQNQIDIVMQQRAMAQQQEVQESKKKKGKRK